MHLHPLEVLLIPSPFLIGLGLWGCYDTWKEKRERRRATVSVPIPIIVEDRQPYRTAKFICHYPRLVKAGEDLPVVKRSQ